MFGGRATKEFRNGDIIFNENDLGREMYVIEEGMVKIFRRRNDREIILAALNKGDFFGEMSLLTEQPRSATAQAVGNCELVIIDKSAFEDLAKEHLVWQILKRMSHMIRDLDDKMENLLIEDELRNVILLFRRYVAPQIVDEVLKTMSTDAIDLSGELREVTVLFADIRNFTSITERMNPHDIVSLLNTYLGEMTHVIFRYDGTIDKYIGDAIMAVFNAPIKQEDHAWLAVSAGLRIQEAMAELQKSNPTIAVGIGVNTGGAILGNIGSELHLDYTVIGDTVNIASRLCKLAHPGELLVSLKTYKLVKDHVQAERLKPKRLKGKIKPIEICKVTGLKPVVKGGEDAARTRSYQKI